MKKLVSLLLALAVCVSPALVPASAIEVQLNGENMTFTDAVPQVKDQRTFLPFRAVFEALGAQVDYEGNVITAVRDNTTVAMTIGSTQVTVTKGDAAKTVEMDVAPYVDAETWRTYVPVRFAAQTLGCAVGWDQEAQTAIVVDPIAFIGKATEGLSFTKIEALGKALDKFNEGIWDLAMDLDGTVSAMGIEVPVTGAMTGTVDVTGSDLTMEMATSLLDQSIDVSVQLRQDKAAGKSYLNLGGDMAALAGANTWYELDLAGISDEGDAANAATNAILSDLDSVEDYEAYAALLQGVLKTVSDDAFLPDGEGDEITMLSTNLDAARLTAVLALLNEAQEVNGGELYLNLDAGENGAASLDVYFDADGAVGITFHLNNRSDKSPISVKLEATGQLTPGTAAPQLAPPEGATVLPMSALTDSAQ